MDSVKTRRQNPRPRRVPSLIEPRGLKKFVTDFTLYKKHAALFVMLLPTIAFFIIFRYIPMTGIQIAFKDFKLSDGIWGSDWNGLVTFRSVFSTNFFWRAVTNTIAISLLKLLIGFPMPVILALLLNEVRHLRFKRTVQTISYLPHFLSWIVLAGLFMNILNPTTGAVNYILTNWFGFEKGIYFLGDNTYFRGVLVATDIWKGVGWGSILYLAGIASIDPGLYEAAVCDGAKRRHRIWHITLPALAPTIVIMLILNIGGILDAGFDQVFNLYNSAVFKTADIIDTYVYRYGLERMQYSLATAVGLFKNGIGFVLVIGTNYVARKVGDYGIW